MTNADYMFTDTEVSAFEKIVEECENAREDLQAAITAVENGDEATNEQLRDVAEALEAWRDAQRHFMETVEASEAPDVSTAAMLLQQNHGIDASEARRGLPGVHVRGADQPFDLDLSGTPGSVLTTAAMEFVSA